MRITRHVKWLWPVAYNASISEISNGKYIQLCNTFSTLETFLAPTGSSNRVTKITPNTLHAYTVQFLVNNSYGLLGRTERDSMVESYCSVQQRLPNFVPRVFVPFDQRSTSERLCKGPIRKSVNIRLPMLRVQRHVVFLFDLR